MAFEKGKSGNPGGRPKQLLPDGRSLREIARDYTDKAIIALADVIDSEGAPAAAKVAAATALLDRGWGRPTQAVEVDANVKVDDDSADFAAWRAVLQTAAAAIASGAQRTAGVVGDGEAGSGHAAG